MQQNVTKALAQLYIRKDNLAAFSQTYDKLYQWLLRCDDIQLDTPGFYMPFDKMIAKSQTKHNKNREVLKLPPNYRLVLQLKINAK